MRPGYIQKTIDKLEGFIEQKNQEITVARNTIALLGSISPFDSVPSDIDKKPKRKYRIKIKDSSAPSPNRKTKASKYIDVYPSVKRKDGTFKWRAQGWDKSAGNKFLGVFDSEELAAAAVADFKGDVGEAQRLRNLHDMIAKKEDSNKTKKEIYYECDHCRMEYQSRPKSCPGCRGASFTKKSRLSNE